MEDYVGERALQAAGTEALKQEHVRLLQKQKEDQYGWSRVSERIMVGAEDREKVSGRTDEVELHRPIQSLVFTLKGEPPGKFRAET